MHKNHFSKTVFVFCIVVLFIGASLVPSTGKIVEKKINKSTLTEVNGLYYLRDDDPFDWLDEGSLLADAPSEEEVTFCGLFILFHFAEQGLYPAEYTINNIYYHIWQRTPESPYEGEIFDLGYYTSGAHNDYMNESITINTSKHIVAVDNYRLVQAMQFTDPDTAFFKGDDIYEFTIKSVGNGPRIRTFPNQYSFVILNLEDNATLKGYDRDGDYLNDYDELYVYYTNPFDGDTDNDGYSDYDESTAGTNPNDFTEFPFDNTPPDKPVGSGPTSGRIGISYDYNFVLTDEDGDNMSLWVDWGDETDSGWIGPYESGEVVTVGHTWNEKGTFTVRYTAKDVYGANSEWGELKVTMPRSKVVGSFLVRFLEKFPLLEMGYQLDYF